MDDKEWFSGRGVDDGWDECRGAGDGWSDFRFKGAVLFAMLMLIAVSSNSALSAPKASSPRECAVFADLALLARAAAKHQVERATLEAVLPDIYTMQTQDGQTIAALIVSAAYAAADVEPATFASSLGGSCMRSGGDMDAILGTGV